MVSRTTLHCLHFLFTTLWWYWSWLDIFYHLIRTRFAKVETAVIGISIEPLWNVIHPLHLMWRNSPMLLIRHSNQFTKKPAVKGRITLLICWCICSSYMKMVNIFFYNLLYSITAMCNIILSGNCLPYLFVQMHFI